MGSILAADAGQTMVAGLSAEALPPLAEGCPGAVLLRTAGHPLRRRSLLAPVWRPGLNSSFRTHNVRSARVGSRRAEGCIAPCNSARSRSSHSRSADSGGGSRHFQT
mmetsp:Transcript_9928/g.36310  ORF Transcript_9928/g.36310 Transcript_9928/m.36310 type:complete len:107 (-) Transcript_9928:142-462(-)